MQFLFLQWNESTNFWVASFKQQTLHYFREVKVQKEFIHAKSTSN